MCTRLTALGDHQHSDSFTHSRSSRSIFCSFAQDYKDELISEIQEELDEDEREEEERQRALQAARDAKKKS